MKTPQLGSALVPLPITGSGVTVTPPSPLTGTDLQTIINQIQAEITAVGLFINVKANGAVGDGTTDDFAALQAIFTGLSAGDTVYFPPGTYKITDALSITVPNVQILGAGNEYGPSIIKQVTANKRGLSLDQTFATADVAAPIVRGVVVEGPAAGTTAAGIYVTADAILENVGVYGFDIGIYLSTTCYYSRISGCLLTNNITAGIYGAGCNDITIEKCRINGYHATSVPPFGDQNTGIKLEGVLGFRIRDCVIEANDSSGIEITGNSAINTATFSGLISGNYFENLASAANGRYIYLHGTTGGHFIDSVEIHGNYFAGNTVSGFVAIDGFYSNYISITGNAFGWNGGGSNTLVAVQGDANSAGWSMWNNVVLTGSTVTLPGTSVRFDFDAGWPVTDPTSVRGDLIFRNNSGVLARLALGAANTVLHGSSTDPSYSAVVPADLDVSADITTANATSGHHGLLAKLSGDATQFLNGSGAFSAPPGGDTSAWQHVHVDNVVFSGDGATTDFELPSAPVDAYSVSVFVAGSRSLDWTLTGGLLTTLSFGSAPASSANNIVVDIAAALA